MCIRDSLYGDISDGITIIMEQPTDSSRRPTRPGYVCKLLKSIYVMRQAGEIWGTVLHSKFVEWGFKQSSQDQRLYFYKSGKHFINFIVVVDDMAISSNNRKLVEWFKNKLTQALKVKLLRTLKIFIGWEFTYACLLYTSPSPRDQRGSRMPSSA